MKKFNIKFIGSIIIRNDANMEDIINSFMADYNILHDNQYLEIGDIHSEYVDEVPQNITTTKNIIEDNNKETKYIHISNDYNNKILFFNCHRCNAVIEFVMKDIKSSLFIIENNNYAVCNMCYSKYYYENINQRCNNDNHKD